MNLIFIRGFDYENNHMVYPHAKFLPHLKKRSQTICTLRNVVQGRTCTCFRKAQIRQDREVFPTLTKCKKEMNNKDEVIGFQ